MKLDASSEAGLYTAGEVEARTGVPAATLRQWERRYGLPHPERAASGYRLYGERDLECIAFLKRHIEEGVPASRAAELYAGRTGREPALRPLGGEGLVSRLAEALVGGRFAAADRVLAEAHAAMPVEDVLLGVVQPALVEIGERWHRGEVTSAHERRASSHLRGKLHGLLELAGEPREGPVVVVACAPGEWHELGPLMFAVFLRRAGLRAHYLGANTPVADLAELAREVGASAVLVSASTEASLEELRREAAALRGAAPVLGLGGLAFNERPGLAADLGGTYLGPDAASALAALLRELPR